jgi:hypothetical protein
MYEAIIEPHSDQAKGILMVIGWILIFAVGFIAGWVVGRNRR